MERRCSKGIVTNSSPKARTVTTYLIPRIKRIEFHIKTNHILGLKTYNRSWMEKNIIYMCVYICVCVCVCMHIRSQQPHIGVHNLTGHRPRVHCNAPTVHALSLIHI